MSSMSSNEEMAELEVDTNNLYREETVTDLKVASIRVLKPIKLDGSDDPDRATQYVASTHVMTQMGPVPIQSEIEAATLEEALGKFPQAVEEAVQKMVEQAREMQRQEAGRIVVPQGGGMPGAGGPGGAPGGGLHVV